MIATVRTKKALQESQLSLYMTMTACARKVFETGSFFWSKANAFKVRSRIPKSKSWRLERTAAKPTFPNDDNDRGWRLKREAFCGRSKANAFKVRSQSPKFKSRRKGTAPKLTFPNDDNNRGWRLKHESFSGRSKGNAFRVRTQSPKLKSRPNVTAEMPTFSDDDNDRGWRKNGGNVKLSLVESPCLQSPKSKSKTQIVTHKTHCMRANIHIAFP